ncbi:outer membrane protein assembly factor BamD [Parvularcula marina]|uniref:Outer membrane protein assembly factor BamD n=1 Tax=Parvularcula marina TaxID=2292771 RepID=A0A371R7P1_9PROT|nr:outer membrane protein assembly factor BamD [Parvularcula marina]RFB01465.1 outer membrane protein assembly factor BamD [Parvularcula marina]
MSANLTRVLFLGCILTLGACSSLRGTDDDRFAYVEEPVEILYQNGARAIERRRYDEAILYFEEVERQHPYSAWARRAMLMTAYSQYLTNDYDQSIESIDRFLSIHPGNKDAAYAYYLKAMNYYERIRDVGRDQDITVKAMSSLEDVVRRYPDTEYARDAYLKLDLTRDHLAGKEMDIGRYYLKKDQHIAALNRFNSVVQNYPQTSHVPEALYRQVEAYIELGVAFEAQRQAALLAYNYPDSEWYGDAYKILERRGLTDLSKLNEWANPESARLGMAAPSSN